MLPSRENSSLHAQHPHAQHTVVNLRLSDGRHETVLLADGCQPDPQMRPPPPKAPTVNINRGATLSRKRGDDPDEDAGFVEDVEEDSQCLAPGDRKMSRESWQSTSRSSHSSITCKNSREQNELIIHPVAADILTCLPRRAECVQNTRGIVIRINADSDLPSSPMIVPPSNILSRNDTSAMHSPPSYGGATKSMTVRQAREQLGKSQSMRKTFNSSNSADSSSQMSRNIPSTPPPTRLAFSSCNLNRDPSREELVIPDVYVRSHSLSPGDTSLDEDDIRTICAVTDLPPNSPMLISPSRSHFTFNQITPQLSPIQSPILSPHQHIDSTGNDDVFSCTANFRRNEFKSNRSDNMTLQPQSAVDRSGSKPLLTTQSMDRSEGQVVDRLKSSTYLTPTPSVDRSESKQTLAPGSIDRSESELSLKPDGSRKKKRRKSNRSIHADEPLKSPWLRSETQIKLAAQRWKTAAKATSLELSEEVSYLLIQNGRNVILLLILSN